MAKTTAWQTASLDALDFVGLLIDGVKAAQRLLLQLAGRLEGDC